MEAADFSIMGRHKHNALTAISPYRGVKNANPKDYIFDQALHWGYGTNIFCENDLFLAQSVLEVEVYSEQGVKELVLMDIRIMNAQWKNKKSFYMAVYMLMNLSWFIYNELSPRVKKGDNTLYGMNIGHGDKFVYGRMCMGTNLYGKNV